MSQIKPGTELFGVKYWAQWWPAPRVPRYEVFRYFGWAKDVGTFYFQHKKHPDIFITKNFHQLRSDNTFRPFLLDTSKLGVEYLVPNGDKV